jgi:hypothetical protein
MRRKSSYKVGWPAPELFESHSLLKIIRFFILDIQEASDLWPILDTLLQTEHEHSMFIQVDVEKESAGEPFDYMSARILWQRPVREDVEPEVAHTTLRLM